MKCKNCKAEFEPVNLRNVYCKRKDCKNERRRLWMQKNRNYACKYCKGKFKKTNPRQVYCSGECRENKRLDNREFYWICESKADSNDGFFTKAVPENNVFGIGYSVEGVTGKWMV